MELKIGDVVKLKSGGPTMTVTEMGKYGYNDREQAKCIWFDGKKKFEDVFEKEALQIVDMRPSIRII